MKFTIGERTVEISGQAELSSMQLFWDNNRDLWMVVVYVHGAIAPQWILWADGAEGGEMPAGVYNITSEAKWRKLDCADLNTEKKQANMLGRVVRTAGTLLQGDFSDSAHAVRREDVTGTIVEHSNSHGLCFRVLHKTKAWYNYDELEQSS